MKFKQLAILALGSGLAVLGVEPLHAQSVPADSTERLSPLDSNPACMERNGPACVTDEVGLRRPPASPVTVFPTPTTTGSSGTGGAVTVIPNTSAPGVGSATAPNVPAADQTGNFSAGRIPSTPGQFPSAGSTGAGNASTPGAANSGGGTMSKGR